MKACGLGNNLLFARLRPQLLQCPLRWRQRLRVVTGLRDDVPPADQFSLAVLDVQPLPQPRRALEHDGQGISGGEYPPDHDCSAWCLPENPTLADNRPAGVVLALS